MSFISKFWKTKSTMEVLEDIDQSIKSISKYKRSSQQSKEKIFWRLSFFTFFLSVVSAVLLYFFTPQTVTDKVIVSLTLTVSPLILYFLNKLLHWWQNTKVSKYEKQLSDLQEKRKEILENVMETETYKRAKEILEKFDPETKKKVEDELMRKNQPKSIPSPVVAANQEIRHRNGSLNGNGRPNGSNVPGIQGVNRPPLPRPILNSHRTMLDKIMEYCVGDGPSNRFALICRNCYSHNGMALAEEFEYLGYRCAYCRFYNDSRKKKPGAPQIFASPKPPTSPSSIKSKSPRSFDNSNSSPDQLESISRRTTPASSVASENLSENVTEPKDEDRTSDDENVISADLTSGDHNKLDFAKSVIEDGS